MEKGVLESKEVSQAGATIKMSAVVIPSDIQEKISQSLARPVSVEPSDLKQLVPVRVIPPTQAGDPWVVVTEGTARDVLSPDAKGKFIPLRLVVGRVKIEDGKNFSVRVFVNSLRASVYTPVKDPHYVGYASFLPQLADNAGFVLNPSRSIRNLVAGGNIRMDRPLIFTFIIAPEDPDRVLTYKDWAIEDVSVIVVRE